MPIQPSAEILVIFVTDKKMLSGPPPAGIDEACKIGRRWKA